MSAVLRHWELFTKESSWCPSLVVHTTVSTTVNCHPSDWWIPLYTLDTNDLVTYPLTFPQTSLLSQFRPPASLSCSRTLSTSPSGHTHASFNICEARPFLAPYPPNSIYTALYIGDKCLNSTLTGLIQSNAL